MSDQSLRAAMEKALDDELCTCEQCEDSDKYNDGVRSVQEAVRKILAAYPTEPAPVVTDEAVQALQAVLVTRGSPREGLEAAAPLLGPRPLLDRDAATEALMAKWADLVERQVEDGTIGHCRSLADAVVPLARPMPTREQIEQAVSDAAAATGLAAYFKSGSLTDPSDLDEFIHAIEVLLNGAES